MGKAVVAHELGPFDTFVLEERDLGAPAAGQVLIDIHTAGVSFVDVLTAQGGYQIKPPVPFVPGSEFSGVVRAVGEGVTHVAPGDRVCAGGWGNAFAEQSLVPSANVLKLPDAMPLDEAAVFRVSYATAIYALLQRGQVAAGETVLVLGAGGAVGYAAVQVAKALGARVIASASSQAKRDLAVRGGADVAVDARAEDWRQQIKDLTGGKGVDVVVDPVGDAATEPAFRSLAWKGRHLVIGFAGGSIAKLPANLALLKGASLVGVDIRQFGEFEPQEAARNITRLWEMYAQGALHPPIASRYPLARYADAMAEAAAGTSAGRVVIEMR